MGVVLATGGWRVIDSNGLSPNTSLCGITLHPASLKGGR